MPVLALLAVFLAIPVGIKWSRYSRLRKNYRPIRWELCDLQDVLHAAKDTNSEDYKAKVDYVIDELRRLT